MVSILTLTLPVVSLAWEGQDTRQYQVNQNPPVQLHQLRRQKQSLEQQAQEVREKKLQTLKQAKHITTVIVKNQKRLDVAQRTLVFQESRLVQTRVKMDYLGDKLTRTLQESYQLSRDAGVRLKKLYMGERLSFMQMVLDANDVTALLDRLYYKQKLVAQDKTLLSRLRLKTHEIALQKRQLSFQKEQIGDTIDQIETVKTQIADRIDADRELRQKYERDAQAYEDAEKELLAESSAIRQQILRLFPARSQSGIRIHGSTGIFAWPLVGSIRSGFGYRLHPVHRRRLMHTGLDISRGSGTPIRAADGGDVIYAGWRGGYGKVVMINHGFKNGTNLVTLYGHMSGWAVSGGQSVTKGQVVGYVGSTGLSTGPHLHFEIRENGSPVDPLKYL
ncbi:MAG: peptidoglycan DD-metalloendopeptidase family protein [Cyanobacteria bacterium]|nr:peptidoglycan DD-metalloendopeptidase family protein [Cyanobacteriota bacterium]